jgi:hypothetical protein
MKGLACCKGIGNFGQINNQLFKMGTSAAHSTYAQLNKNIYEAMTLKLHFIRSIVIFNTLNNTCTFREL